jgi:hypothetical protein
MVTQEKDSVIKAINDLGRRVTAADIATKTGLPLSKATSELNKVASETNGHLQVSTAGDIAYSFDPGFQSAYLAQGMKKIFQQIGDKIGKAAFFLLRISFGVGLILSFIVIALLIIALILFVNKGSDSDNDSGGFGGIGGLDFFDFMILRNFFYWGPTYPVYTTYGYNDYNRPYDLYDKPTTRQPDTNNNFIMNCFSFLFGDGSPNLNLEDRKWQLIAQMIKQNNGVVTAEQLAPFTGADPANEDGVLPVLVRFDGKPEVTDSGNIVYTFPTLQVTAKSMSFAPLPTYLKEFDWEFTRVPTSSLVPVFILAGLNFFGALFLVAHTHTAPILHAFSGLIHWLLLYGTLFLVVPTVRFFVLKWRNAAIELRNVQRSQFSEALKNPAANLLKKLGEAKHYRIGEKRIKTDDVVYTTEKDVMDQDFNNEGRKFDAELKKGKYSEASPAVSPAAPQSPSHTEYPPLPKISQESQDAIDHIISIKPKEKSEVKPEIKSKPDIKSKRPFS